MEKDEEVITAIEAYFVDKEKTIYKHGIEKLWKRWNDCIALGGEYVDKNQFCDANIILLVNLRTY